MLRLQHLEAKQAIAQTKIAIQPSSRMHFFIYWTPSLNNAMPLSRDARKKKKIIRYPEYKCKICGKQYRILGNYEKHMLLEHIQKGEVST
jgi:predicted restriction endonuclease